jgi:D-threonine aldolase
MNTETLKHPAWYKIKNVEPIDVRAFLLYPELVAQNIHHAIQMVGDAARLRPHAKTNKSEEATSLMMVHGYQEVQMRQHR